MPTYDYKCEKCNASISRIRRIQQRNDPIVCDCGGTARRVYVFTTNKDWFRAHWNDDITGTPIYIDSKNQYKKVCEENGVMARCLL